MRSQTHQRENKMWLSRTLIILLGFWDGLKIFSCFLMQKNPFREGFLSGSSKCPSPFQSWLRWESQIQQESRKDQGLKKSNLSSNSGIFTSEQRFIFQKSPALTLQTFVSCCHCCYPPHPWCPHLVHKYTRTWDKKNKLFFPRLPPLNPKLRPPNFGKHVTTFFSFAFSSLSQEGVNPFKENF